MLYGISLNAGSLVSHFISKSKKFLTRPLRTFRFFQKVLKKLLIGFKWIDLHLENPRDDLTCSGIRTKSCNETNHCCPAIELFCFRSHKYLEILNKYKVASRKMRELDSFSLSRELIFPIRRVYLIVEII